MKKWVMFEITNGDSFETVLNAENKQDAINEALGIWNRMTSFDQKRDIECYIGYVDVEHDEDTDRDIIDYSGVPAEYYADIRSIASNSDI